MDDNTLPDLDSDKTIEQVIFENRIFDKNVAHIITHNGIKSWFESSPFHRFYPETAMKNKCAFRKKTQNYLYNQETGVLRKYVKGVDGVGKYQKCRKKILRPPDMSKIIVF